MRRFNIIIALSATLGLSSCDLDMTPMDQVSDAVFWQKPSDFELAANDFYFSLMEASQYIDKNSDIAFGSGADFRYAKSRGSARQFGGEECRRQPDAGAGRWPQPDR